MAHISERISEGIGRAASSIGDAALRVGERTAESTGVGDVIREAVQKPLSAAKIALGSGDKYGLGNPPEVLKPSRPTALSALTHGARRRGDQSGLGRASLEFAAAVLLCVGVATFQVSQLASKAEPAVHANKHAHIA